MTQPTPSPQAKQERSMRGTYVLVLLFAFGLIGLLYWFTAAWNQPLPGAR